MRSVTILSLASIAWAACPYSGGDLGPRVPEADSHTHLRRAGSDSSETKQFLSQFHLDDSNSFLTTDFGVAIPDQESLSAGDRGPTLLEDFIFRQKIQRFDHERVSFFYFYFFGRVLGRFNVKT